MAKCAQCRTAEGQSDGLCPQCRLRALGLATRKYRFTPALRDELLAAYRLKKMPRAVAIRKMMARTGWPLHAFKCEAIRMGCTTWSSRPWKAEEEEYLREKAGAVSTKAIATYLGRSVASVESRMERMHLSRRLTEGYNIDNLCEVFGVTGDRVKGWMRRGLLGKVHEVNGLRVTESNVIRFIREHSPEYDLRRVDQHWYKAMIFEAGV